MAPAMSPVLRSARKTKALAERARLAPISRRVLGERLTYLAPGKLRTLERLARDVNRDGVQGDFYEAGIALGGSAIVLATRLRSPRARSISNNSSCLLFLATDPP